MDADHFKAYLTFLVRSEGSQSDAARAWGISKQYLSDVLRGKREPGPKLLQALAIRREVRYVEDPKEEAHAVPQHAV